MPEAITLDINSPPVQYLCKKDKRLAKVISMVGAITYITHKDDPYAFLVHEIIEQMLSVKAGIAIYNRFSVLCNGNVSPEIIQALSFDEIKSIGTASSKVRCIKEMTNEVVSGHLNFDDFETMTDDEITSKLLSIYGIGKWTAKMYLIFVLDRPDILPVEDVAFLQAYKWVYKTDCHSKEEMIKRCRKWKPYSSYAARYLYRALDSGLTKTEFHLYK